MAKLLMSYLLCHALKWHLASAIIEVGILTLLFIYIPIGMLHYFCSVYFDGAGPYDVDIFCC
jgi:hypothetical protein